MSGAAIARPRPVRIVKVGGSLLDWPPLPGALQTWLGAQPPACNILLAGGGDLADAIRRADAKFAIGEETAHWLCIDLLGVSARLLAAICGKVEVIAKFGQLHGRIESAPRTLVFDPCDFLYQEEPGLPGCALPHNWSVTTDAIAARLAEVLAAEELVLLKSQDPPNDDLVELARLGYVDGHFPLAAAGLVQIRFKNLRGVG